jgi:hypothetical protein
MCGGAYFARDMGIADVHMVATNGYRSTGKWKYLSLAGGTQGKTTLKPLPGFRTVFGNSGGLWEEEETCTAATTAAAAGMRLNELVFANGPLMSASPWSYVSVSMESSAFPPGSCPDPRCGPIVPLATFGADLLADVRQRIIRHPQAPLGIGEGDLPPAGVMPHAWAVIRSSFGVGRVLLFSPHPEMTHSPPASLDDRASDLTWMMVSAVQWAKPTLQSDPERVTRREDQLEHGLSLESMQGPEPPAPSMSLMMRNCGRR